MAEGVGGETPCPFCRSPFTGSDEDHMRRLMKRVDANDPEAYALLACQFDLETDGVRQDKSKANINKGGRRGHINIG